jgi:membrane-associated phospholipid phosphatase
MLNEPPAIVVDWTVDLGVTAAGGAAWIASELALPSIGPHACRWCNPPGFDESVRDALVWSSPSTADTTSSLAAFVVAPAVAFGGVALAASSPAREPWLDDALVVAESAILAGDANQVTKLVVARERPRARFGAVASPSADDHLSFYSGHTTLAFALATSSGTIASRRGSPLAPAIWIAGLAVGATTGYLRIAADAHYLSDVLVGAATGAAFGVAVPWLHAPKAGDVRVTSLRVPGGAGLALAGAW